jgi:hypothetical protein
MAELWGYKNDLSGDILKVEGSDQDYCLIRWTDGTFVVEIYDTPVTMLRDLGDYFSSTKTRAVFTQRVPRTKKAVYGR